MDTPPKKNKPKGLQSLAQILANINSKDTGKYLAHEWQLFGYRLAVALMDHKRMSYYMKLAKNEERGVLEAALDFVKESKNAKSKAALFFWKLKQIKIEKKEKLAKKSNSELQLNPVENPIKI